MPVEQQEQEVIEVVDEVDALIAQFEEGPSRTPTLEEVQELVASLPQAESGGDNRVGLFQIDMGFGFIGGREVHIREQSMCDGQAKAWVYYNRNLGKVLVFAFFDGLPYKMDLCYDYNPTTPQNEYPDCINDGVWQIWFAGRYLTRESTFYYDGVSGDLLGNEFDLDGPPPPGAIGIDLPVVQMLCTPSFQSTPWLGKFVLFQFDYDQMIDAAGNGGVFAGGAPTNLFDPTSLDAYYTNDGLPPSEAMSMDDILDDLEARDAGQGVGNILMATSLEPDPKPDYLVSRDNLMIGWGGSVLPDIATGLPVDLSPYGECGTFQLPDPFAP